MPEIARLNNIIIHMLYFDTKQHNEPHIHITYNEYEVSISLHGDLLAGKLPSKQYDIVTEWIKFYYDALFDLWEKAKIGKHIDKV